MQNFLEKEEQKLHRGTWALKLFLKHYSVSLLYMKLKLSPSQVWIITEYITKIKNSKNVNIGAKNLTEDLI